ncbi:hypothetical protein AAG570_010090 [Ranatra chinensis]|uniref:Uncharacterized protein n=1 Tax=Ranatra chinensis TaxID=642074 RepID=A0ABD0Z3N3_9HEMI
MCCRSVGGSRRCSLLVCCLLSSVVVLCGVLLVWHQHQRGGSGPPLHHRLLVPPNPETSPRPSPSLLHKFTKAAVCTDGPPCSKIGRDLLKKGGSAVDAALGALFCNGLVSSQSMGLGGGFMMTTYSRESGKAHSLIARDAAPLAATADMFAANLQLSQTGGLAVGVPGELRGYWEAWLKFGRLKWSEVIEPTIELCRDGYHMTKHQYDMLTFRPKAIEEDPLLREAFVNPHTGEYYRPGSLIKLTKICETLKIISEEGGDAMHNGSLTKLLVEDIREKGGIITEEDFNNYKAEWVEPVNVTLHGGETVYSAPAPGSGALLTFILNLLDGYNMSTASVSNMNASIITTHRLIEAFKYAYAKRTELADPHFVDMIELVHNLTSKEYAEEIRSKILDNTTFDNVDHYGAVFYTQDTHGTAHISVLSGDGDAVSVTSTINLYFGAGFVSKHTGIILNSAMDDFSVPGLINYFGLPPSPNNFIEPGKRPLSSACPTIVVAPSGNVSLVVGASGGTKIISAVAWVIMRHLWFGENVKQAVDASRIHHQLYPMEISYEYGILDQLIKGLEKLGHKTSRYRDRGSIICAIAKEGDLVFSNADYRKGGEVYGLD